MGIVAGGVRIHSFATETVNTPRPVGPDIIASLFDTTPVPITTTAAWQKVPSVVTRHALLNHRTIWQRMHFDDWDGVPRKTREAGITAMLDKYANVLDGPSQWAGMSTFDWDDVPQPIRAIAYLRMIWYWTGHEQVGAGFGWDPLELAPVIAAIVMAESWFEHRAVNENAWGRDLGLAQCSDHCRLTLRAMASVGEVPFLLEDEQYFNPWFATRVATVWFARELERAEGDLELAIRAYHRGIDDAYDEKGDAYLAGVLRRRALYILNQGTSESWRFLVEVTAARTTGSASRSGPA